MREKTNLPLISPKHQFEYCEVYLVIMYDHWKYKSDCLLVWHDWLWVCNSITHDHSFQPLLEGSLRLQEPPVPQSSPVFIPRSITAT